MSLSYYHNNPYNQEDNKRDGLIFQVPLGIESKLKISGTSRFYMKNFTLVCILLGQVENSINVRIENTFAKSFDT